MKHICGLSGEGFCCPACDVVRDNQEKVFDAPDKNCITLPDGDCIGKGCMHDADYPQDASAKSALSGDTCPRCGGQLDFDEVDIGVGILRGNPGCPDCHWVPEPVPELMSCPRCGTPGDQDDCPECHPERHPYRPR